VFPVRYELGLFIPDDGSYSFESDNIAGYKLKNNRFGASV
jgi:hypothetical protein